jgi:probable F420-dependent oxidoreductase
MSRIRIAAQLHPQHGSFRQFRQASRDADEIGYDLIYTWDHFYPLYGDRDGSHFECWSLLAAMAEITERAEIGPLVSAVPYRSPDLVADMARTIDHISGGRLVLGLGAGWLRRDFEEYGFEFGTVRGRLAELEAALPRIVHRFERLVPPPTRRIPILIGGVGERHTLRLVAAHADGWHAMFPARPDQLEPKVAALLRWCDEAGRNPAEIEMGVGVEPDDLDRFLDEDAEVYVGMGFTQFTLGFNGPDWPVEAGKRWLEWRDACNQG